jgi:hypothetical protein
VHPNTTIEVPKWALLVLNNLCDIERKLTIHGDPGNAKRNLERIKEAFEGQKLFYEDPSGEPFTETRTDIEASITGAGTENLVVVEVIKPIVRYGDASFSKVVQKGIVVVESRNEGAA